MSLPSPPFNVFEGPESSVDGLHLFICLIPLAGIGPTLMHALWSTHRNVSESGLANQSWNTFLIGLMAQSFYAGLFLVYLALFVA